MTTGHDPRKIGTDHRPAGDGGGGRGAGGARHRPVLEHDSRRTFTEPTPGASGPGERHELDRINRIRIVLLSGWGGVLGFVLGLFAAMLFREAPFAALYPFLGGFAGWLVVFAIVGGISAGAGGLFSNIYAPGGRSGPRREYSLAESLVARGRYEDAVSAFEMAVAEHPDDPVPCIRIARVCRDHLGDPERAARWFRRARDVPGLGDARWRVLTRELIELHGRRDPTRAAPELARLAELHPGTAEGEWARGELAEVKRLIAEERGLQ